MYKYDNTCIYMYIYICIFYLEPKWPLFPLKRGLLLEGFFSPQNGGQTSSRVYMYLYIYIYIKCSMYGISTYIWLIFMVIVDKYTIHWASGICTLSMKLSIGDPSHPPNISSNRIQATIHRHQPVHWLEGIWFHRGGSTGAGAPGTP